MSYLLVSLQTITNAISCVDIVNPSVAHSLYTSYANCPWRVSTVPVMCDTTELYETVLQLIDFNKIFWKFYISKVVLKIKVLVK